MCVSGRLSAVSAGWDVGCLLHRHGSLSLPPKSRTVWSALRSGGGLTPGPSGPTTLPDFWGSPPEPAWEGQRAPCGDLLWLSRECGGSSLPREREQVPAPGAPRVGSTHSRSRPAGLGSRVPEAAVPVPVTRCRAAAPPQSRAPSAALPRAWGSPRCHHRGSGRSGFPGAGRRTERVGARLGLGSAPLQAPAPPRPRRGAPRPSPSRRRGHRLLARVKEERGSPQPAGRRPSAPGHWSPVSTLMATQTWHCAVVSSYTSIPSFLRNVSDGFSLSLPDSL